MVLVDVVREEGAGLAGIEALATSIGAIAEVVDPYVGFISHDVDDDLSFVIDDPPVEIVQPLALVYFGPRYLGGEPAWAAHARIPLSKGVVVVPRLVDLA